MIKTCFPSYVRLKLVGKESDGIVFCLAVTKNKSNLAETLMLLVSSCALTMVLWSFAVLDVSCSCGSGEPVTVCSETRYTELIYD